MPERLVHLVRHGEVDNPGGVVYGRLQGFPLSGRGQRLADAAAEHVFESGRAIASLRSSPLLRTRQSAEPFAERLGTEAELRPELIEASSRLEGKDYDVSLAILARPAAWRFLINPLRPSWGEPYTQVRGRMMAEVDAAFAAPGDGDVVLVSHQMPIVMVARTAAGKPLAHDPRRRRCALSSVTTLTKSAGRIVEYGYFAPEVI